MTTLNLIITGATSLFFFILGWVLSKNSIKNIYIKKINNLTNNLLKNGDAIKKLKDINIEKEKKIETISLELKGAKNKLILLEKSLSNNLNKKESNQDFFNENIELKNVLKQKEEEITGLEGVLIKAETVIEKQNNKIDSLKGEEDSLENNYEELLITKEQLFYIEIQLLKYQKEISNLKKINRELESKSNLRKETINNKNIYQLSNSTIMKLFGNRYRKIIKY